MSEPKKDMKEPKKKPSDVIEAMRRKSDELRAKTIIGGYEDMLKKELESPEFQKQADLEQMMRERMTDLPDEAVMLSDVYDISSMFPSPKPEVNHVYTPLPTQEDIEGYVRERNRETPMWKFGELEALHELEVYIGRTYEQHYASQEDGIQAFDAIVAAGHGVGFCVGDIIKYAMRLGKKDGWNRKDVMKILHYGILLLHAMEKEKR